VKFTNRLLTVDFAAVANVLASHDPCATIIQGLECTDRIGRSIYLRSISLYGTLVGGQSNSVADDSYNTLRMSVVACTDGATLAGYTLQSIQSPEVITGLEHTYMDKFVALSTPGRDSVGYLPAVRRITWTCPINRVIRYRGAAANTVNGTTVRVAMISDSVAAPSPGFVSGCLVFAFTDV
jgi:hypothetical protein